MNFYRKDKGIISLVAILTIGILALSAVTISSIGSLKELTKNRNNVMGEQSFYTAEAAAREGIYQYKKNSASYSGGNAILLNDSSTAQITVNSLPWPYGEVIGVAVNDMPNGTTSRKVIFTTTVFPEGQAFDYAIFSDDSIDIKSNSAIITGDVLSNSAIDDDHDRISGLKFENTNPPLVPPQIDIEAYRNAPGVTFFEEKKVTNPSVSGTLAVIGDLEITTSKNYTATPDYDYPAIIVKGKLTLNGGNVRGIIYVDGNVDISGNPQVEGTILATGTTEISGGGNPPANIKYNPELVSGWTELLGLNHESTYSEPKIIRWREE